MKKLDLGQSLGILANVGVIGGILLLAYELRQNNDLMAAEARFNRLAIVSTAWARLAENGELTELRLRADNQETLTEVEQRRVDAALMGVFVFLEWTHRELSSDSPEMRQVRTIMRGNFANNASYRDVWEVRNNAFSPDFVRWMEENVVNVNE